MQKRTLEQLHAMPDAHEAKTYNQRLAAEIQKAIDDPRPSVSHEKVMAELQNIIDRARNSDSKG